MKFKVRNIYGLDKLDEYKSKKGLKSSNKRLAVIQYFLKNPKHYSTEELYQEMKKVSQNISLSTVYRALKLLVECGLASIRHFDKGQARFEPVHREEHHDHLICIECGRIIEFKDRDIEEHQEKIASKHNFLIKDHKLEIYGICQKCKKGK